MADQGILASCDETILASSIYKSSLESLEEIESGKECVVIRPYQCEQQIHLVLQDEFIRSNLKGEFKNPYTRNLVEFSEKDQKTLQEKRQEFIRTIKNKPHEIFLRFLGVLEKIKETSTEMFYLPFISKIFVTLLSSIPIFETLDEVFGQYDEFYSETIKKMERRLDTEILLFEKELANPQVVEQFQNAAAFMTIPDSFKIILQQLFERFLEQLHVLASQKREFEFKDRLLDIFLNMDDVHYYLSKKYEIIAENETYEKALLLILMKSETLITELDASLTVT